MGKCIISRNLECEMQEKKRKVADNNKKEPKVKLKDKVKEDFLAFLNENKKELSTGFGAFHTDDHSNW